jgi:hypothetical protein
MTHHIQTKELTTWFSEFKVISSNLKFQVRFSVDRLTQSGNFENLLELNQSLLPKENLILMDCYTSENVQILWRSASIYFNGANKANQLSLQTEFFPEFSLTFTPL